MPSKRKNPSKDLFRSLQNHFTADHLCFKGGEEGGDDAKSAWPFDTLGYTRVTIASTTGRNIARWSKPLQKMRQFG